MTTGYALLMETDPVVSLDGAVVELSTSADDEGVVFAEVRINGVARPDAG